MKSTNGLLLNQLQINHQYTNQKFCESVNDLTLSILEHCNMRIIKNWMN